MPSHEYNELVIDYYVISYIITYKNENFFPLMFLKFWDIFPNYWHALSYNNKR